MKAMKQRPPTHTQTRTHATSSSFLFNIFYFCRKMDESRNDTKKKERRRTFKSFSMKRKMKEYNVFMSFIRRCVVGAVVVDVGVVVSHASKWNDEQNEKWCEVAQTDEPRHRHTSRRHTHKCTECFFAYTVK